MNKMGKTSTVLLIISFVLLSSFTAITVFFFQKEKEMRKTAEEKLAQTEASRSKLDAELKEAKKNVFLLEEKNKEADEKINSLLNELELEEGLREQLKLENIALQEALKSQEQDSNDFKKDLIAAQEKISLLEDQLKTSKQIQEELRNKIDKIEKGGMGAMALEQVNIAPEDIRPGKILRVDKDNNFVILDLGRLDGIINGMTLSVFRDRKQLGEIKVMRVQNDMSVADPIPPLKTRSIRENDEVVVKQ